MGHREHEGREERGRRGAEPREERRGRGEDEYGQSGWEAGQRRSTEWGSAGRERTEDFADRGGYRGVGDEERRGAYGRRRGSSGDEWRESQESEAERGFSGWRGSEHGDPGTRGWEPEGERWRSGDVYGGGISGGGMYGRYREGSSGNRPDYGERWRGGDSWGEGRRMGGQSMGRGQSMGGGLWGQERESTSGGFAGRGPKGYKRSDERIKEEICEEMTRDPDLDASEIEIRVQDGEITLTGAVRDRHAKRLAEDISESASGVKEVNNQLRVRPAGSDGHETAGAGKSGAESSGKSRTETR